MGFSYGAACYNRISEDAVKAVCPEEFAAFMQSLREIGSLHSIVEEDLLEEFVQAHEYGDNMGSIEESEEIEIARAYNRLTEEFEKRTQLGLNLSWVSDGFRGSDVSDEMIWHVNGVYIRSSAAEQFEQLYGDIEDAWHITGG